VKGAPADRPLEAAFVNIEQAEPVLRLLDDLPFRRPRPLTLRWGAIGLIVLAAGVYFRAVLVNDFFWQDQAMLNGVASWFGLTHVWTRAAGAYRPVALSLLWIEHRGFGSAPMLYHLVGVAIHAANCVLLWFVLRRLDVRGAWLAAAMFAVLPVQVQSVAWISQQPHLVCTLFYLIAVLAYLRWLQIPPRKSEATGDGPQEPPSRVNYFLAFVAGAVAALSDPAGLSLPLVLVLLVWWKRATLLASQWLQLAPFVGIALIVALLSIVLHHTSPALAGVAPAISVVPRIVFAGRAVVFQAINTFRLYPPQLIHSPWTLAFDLWGELLTFLILGLGLVAWMGRRRWGTGPVVCLLVYLALPLPGLIIMLSQTAPMIYVADHQQYLASAAVLAAAGVALMWVAARLEPSLTLRGARAAVGVAAIGLLTAFAIAQSVAYRDTDSAFKAAVAHDPANAIVRAQYAMYLSADQPDRALKVLDAAGSSDASNLMLLDARARVLLSLGRCDEAISSYLVAERLAPDHRDVRLGLAAAYDAAGAQAMADGRHEDAVQNYNSALATYALARDLTPDDAAVCDGIGCVLLHERRFTDSVDQFDTALALDSAFVVAHVHKSQALFQAALQGDAGNVSLANAELREALRIEPTNVEALCASASMQFQLRNFGAAEQYYRSAIQVDPDSAQTWTELGFVLSAESHFQEAMRSFERALMLRSDAPDALRGKRLAQARLATENQKS
jgi:tetratricopeptide (TPR) repeat protein